MNRLVLTLFLACSAMWAECALAQAIQPNTTWKNNRGSELTISAVDTTGKLTGTYVNRAAGFQCQNTPYPVIGWIEDDKISFSVRWKSVAMDCKSITSWTGYLSGNRIISDWDLVYTDTGENRPMLYRGTDYFTKQ